MATGAHSTENAATLEKIKNFDKTPDVYNYYGELLIDQQKFQEAIEKFDTAVEMEKQIRPTSMNTCEEIRGLNLWCKRTPGCESRGAGMDLKSACARFSGSRSA